MDIGNRIKMIRQSEGLNQREFAASIKIGQPTLAMFENGQRLPKDIHIEQICSKFNVNESWLRTGEGEMYKKTVAYDEMADYVSDLLEDDDNPLYDIIRNIMKTYSQLDPQSQRTIDLFSENLLENLKKEG